MQELDKINNKVIIGTWPISGDFGNVDLISVQKILEHTYELGFRQFDTAPNYGNGFSEFSLGKVFSKKKDCLINTKIGNLPFSRKSFEIKKIRRSFEESLIRLNCDCINILFLHNPRDDVENYVELLELMKQLKVNGLIRYLGLSKAKNINYKSLVKEDSFDYIQDDINLLNLKPIININNINTKLIARSPLASGILSGSINLNSTFTDDDQRSTWLKADRLKSILKRVKIIDSLSNIPLISLARTFILNQKCIHNVIFGVKSIQHVDDLFNNIQAPEISGDLKEKLIYLFKNDYGLDNESHLNF